MTSRDDSKTTLPSDFAKRVGTMEHFIALYAVWSQEPRCKDSLSPSGDTKTAAQKIFPEDYYMIVQADAKHIKCWPRKEGVPVLYTELTIGTFFEAVKCFIMRKVAFEDETTSDAVLYAVDWCRRYCNNCEQCRPSDALAFALQTLPAHWRKFFLHEKKAPALEARNLLYLQLIKTLQVGAEIKESMTRHVSETRVEGPYSEEEFLQKVDDIFSCMRKKPSLDDDGERNDSRKYRKKFFDGKCDHCHKHGHKRRDCPNLNNRKRYQDDNGGKVKRYRDDHDPDDGGSDHNRAFKGSRNNTSSYSNNNNHTKRDSRNGKGRERNKNNKRRRQRDYTVEDDTECERDVEKDTSYLVDTILCETLQHATAAEESFEAIFPSPRDPSCTVGLQSLEGDITFDAGMDTQSNFNQITATQQRFLEKKGVHFDPSPVTASNTKLADGSNISSKLFTVTCFILFNGIRYLLQNCMFRVVEAIGTVPPLIGQLSMEKAGIVLMDPRSDISYRPDGSTAFEYDSFADYAHFSYSGAEIDFDEAKWRQTKRLVRFRSGVEFQAMMRRVKHQMRNSDWRLRQRFVDLLARHKSIFQEGLTGRIVKGIDYHVDVINKDFRPPRPFSQQVSPLSERIISYIIDDLIEMGVVRYHCDGVLPTACNVFLVGTDEKPRLVVNTSKLRNLVVKDGYYAPTAEQEISKIGGKDKNGLSPQFFGAWDIPNAYYQIPYDPRSPIESRIFHFQNKTYVFNNLVMGGPNSMAALNRALDSIFNGLPRFSHVADDSRISGSSLEDFVENTSLFLERCEKHNITLRPSKSVPIAKSTYWCGYYVDKDGFKADPHSKNIVLAWERPTTGKDLAKAVGIGNWMKLSIPNYEIIKTPLQNVLEKMYQSVGNSRKNAAIARLKVVDFGWDETCDSHWKKFKDALANVVQLAHRDVSKTLVLYTDASMLGWSGFLCQIDPQEINKDPSERNHQPLAFLGANFTKTQANWPTVEQEGYAIKRSIERMWHIVNDGTKLLIYTDNAALRDIFDKNSDYISTREKPGQGRLLRWCDMMQSVNYDIFHISGEKNVVSDFLSRSFLPRDLAPVPDEDNDNSPPCYSFRAVNESLATSVLDSNWKVPTVHDIHSIAGKDGQSDAQFLSLAEAHNCTFDERENLWKTQDGKILVPSDPSQLRRNLLLTAHSFVSGHVGVDATLEQLRELVFWPEMKDDVKALVSSCIVCRSHDPDVRRPYGDTIIPTDRNQVLCADFLHLTDSEDGGSKILILSDKLSKFSLFFRCDSESTEVALDAILSWTALFGAPKVLVTDQGPAFNNSVIEKVANKLKIEPHMISAHAHWAHGSQERINRSIRDLFKKLLTENKLHITRWADLLHIVLMAFNHRPTKSLNNWAPVTVFVGLPHSRPMDFFRSVDSEFKNLTTSKSLDELVESLQQKLDTQTITVHETIERNMRARQDTRLNQKNVKPLEAKVGDYVLVKDTSLKYPKLSPKWIGPAVVTQLHKDKNFTVKFLHNNKSQKLHESFVKFYANDDLQVSPALLQHANYVMAKRARVKEFKTLGVDNGVYSVEVVWNDGDVTWEPLKSLFKDIPERITEYLNSLEEHVLVRGAKLALKLPIKNKKTKSRPK